jgi:DNA invertase Pin-like site-specific DNA recombinase
MSHGDQELNETPETTMTVFGYARASTLDQSTDIQIDQLKAAGCELVRTEKKSGTSRENRTELQTLLEW